MQVKAFLNILGGIFLLVGIGWIISVVVAVANHSGLYPTLTSLIPPFVIHAVCEILGISLIGLAMRLGKVVPVSSQDAV